MVEGGLTGVAGVERVHWEDEKRNLHFLMCPLSTLLYVFFIMIDIFSCCCLRFVVAFRAFSAIFWAYGEFHHFY